MFELMFKKSFFTCFKLQSTLLFFITSFALFAQTPIYETIDLSDGLPTNYVYRVLESQDGYIWICTERGICKYDGLELICYNSNNGLPDNDYYLAFEDPLGRIWVNGLSRTLSCFYRDSIYNIHFSKNEIVQRVAVNDSMFYFHDDGNILSIDSNFNVKRLSLSEVESYDKDLNDYFSNLCKDDYQLVESQDLLTPSVVGKVLSNKAIQFCFFDSIQNKFVNKIYPQSDANFYTIIQHSFADNKIQIFEHEKLILTDSQFSNFDTILIEAENDIYTNSAYVDSKNNLWISTKKGILVRHNTQREIDLLEYEETKGQNVTHILNYEQDYIFANDLEQIFSYNDNQFQNIFSEILSSRNNFYSLEIFDSKLFFSNGPNGLRSLDFDFNISNYEVDTKFNGTSELPRNCHPKQFDLYSDFGFYLNRGLYIVDFKKELTRKINKGTYTNILYSETDSMLWISDRNFLYGYQFDKVNFDVELTIKHAIPNTEYIFQLTKGSLLVSNFAGSNYICRNGECLINNTFVNEKIISCKKYNDKYYLSTLNALYEITGDDFLEKNKVVDYRTLGRNRTVNDFILYNNRFVFATNKGLVSVMKNINVEQNGTSDFPFFIDSINGMKTERIIKNEQIVLPYSSRKLNISFHSNIFNRIKDFTYEYELIGVDDDRQITNQRKVSYLNLNPGEYKFQIRANDGYSNYSEFKTFGVIVAYPWWLRWYSVLLWIGFFIGLVYLGMQYFRNQLNSKLGITKKLAELELNALQSQMNPHFVFNALNSIQNLVISNKIDLADKYLSRFSQLMRLFLESSRHKFISLSEELIIINRYLEIEKLRFGDKLIYNVENELSDLDQKVLVPATILQPFVENALVHGLFHKKGIGHLDIKLTSEKDFLKIQITDDGVGRAIASNLRKTKTYKSRGMEIINEKLSLLKKLEDIDISYTIRDLDEKSGNGTQVVIKIVNV